MSSDFVEPPAVEWGVLINVDDGTAVAELVASRTAAANIADELCLVNPGMARVLYRTVVAAAWTDEPIAADDSRITGGIGFDGGMVVEWGVRYQYLDGHYTIRVADDRVDADEAVRQHDRRNPGISTARIISRTLIYSGWFVLGRIEGVRA